MEISVMPTVSIIIPMHNEEQNVKQVIKEVNTALKKHHLKGEIIAVDDRSTDNTEKILDKLKEKNNLLKVIHRSGDVNRIEIGWAIRDGINAVKCSVVAIMMGDSSDDPEDMVKMVNKIKNGYDIVIGSRFCEGGEIYGYPSGRLIFNRLCNYFVKYLFRLRTNDISNAFKVYRRDAIKSIKIESPDFNVLVEIPLKLIKKGFRYTQVPVKWFGRKKGVSKLKVLRIGPNYLKTIFKIFISDSI